MTVLGFYTNKLTTESQLHKYTVLSLPPYLLIYETEKGNADLHAQMMQSKDGRLQQEEADGEE